MSWTEIPTESGYYYWARRKRSGEIEVVYFNRMTSNNRLCIATFTNWDIEESLDQFDLWMKLEPPPIEPPVPRADDTSEAGLAACAAGTHGLTTAFIESEDEAAGTSFIRLTCLRCGHIHRAPLNVTL